MGSSKEVIENCIRVAIVCEYTFDGDTLNIVLIINRDFLNAAHRVFNPAQAMVISKNDGYFNNDYNMQRDTVINSSTMMHLSREYYTQDQLDMIAKLKAMKPDKSVS